MVLLSKLLLLCRLCSCISASTDGYRFLLSANTSVTSYRRCKNPRSLGIKLDSYSLECPFSICTPACSIMHWNVAMRLIFCAIWKVNRNKFSGHRCSRAQHDSTAWIMDELPKEVYFLLLFWYIRTKSLHYKRWVKSHMSNLMWNRHTALLCDIFLCSFLQCFLDNNRKFLDGDYFGKCWKFLKEFPTKFDFRLCHWNKSSWKAKQLIKWSVIIAHVVFLLHMAHAQWDMFHCNLFHPNLGSCNLSRRPREGWMREMERAHAQFEPQLLSLQIIKN